MKCFYQGRTRPSKTTDDSNGLVSFSIPDIGIIFRARFAGTQEECEYASLLALLEFVELNPHLFKNKRIEVFGNDNRIISQVNQKMKPPRKLEPYVDMAVEYKRKFPFTLRWIPDSENVAQDGLAG